LLQPLLTNGVKVLRMRCNNAQFTHLSFACHAGAWRSIIVAGQRRLLQPLLITGAKVWHLRPGSCCYTKHQFWAAASQLPAGSEVVLLLGEIDCREGLLVAVEKMKVRYIAEFALLCFAIRGAWIEGAAGCSWGKLSVPCMQYADA
jgi:hypothetical protein